MTLVERFLKYVSFDTQSNKIILANTYITEFEKIDRSDLPIAHKTPTYATKLQLCNLNTQVSYPFSDRLIEALVGNMIKPDSMLDTDIERIQKILTLKKYHNIGKLISPAHYGIWDKNLSDHIYKLAVESGLINDTFDITGYVDKDIENYIGDSYEN